MKVLAGLCILLSLMMVSCNNAYAQEPSPVNLTVEKNKLKMEINYPSDDPIEISLLASLNHGLTWDIIPQKVKGDVGFVNNRSSEKLIVWDILDEVGRVNMDRVGIRVSVNGSQFTEVFVKVKPESDEFEVYDTPDVLPSPIGETELYKHLEYPELARSMGITGSVFVQFVVNEKGLPEQITTIRSSHSLFDEVAIRAISKTTINPGMKDGKPIKVRMTQRILFNLKEDYKLRKYLKNF